MQTVVTNQTFAILQICADTPPSSLALQYLGNPSINIETMWLKQKNVAYLAQIK
jgi:hypothetical protein